MSTFASSTSQCILPKVIIHQKKKVKVKKQHYYEASTNSNRDGGFPPFSSQGQLNKAQGNAALYPTSHRSLKANLYFSPITGQEKRKLPITLLFSLCQLSWKMRQFKARLPFPFLQPGACSYLGCIWRVFSLKQLSTMFGICKWEDSITF